MPDVSIIIPCKNEGSLVEMTVNSILGAKSAVDYELLVVDDGSEDGCCDFLQGKDFPGQLYRTDGLGASRARNHGAAQACGQIFVFCDGHIVVEDCWLDRLTACFADKNVGAVSPAVAAFDGKGVGCGQTWNERLEVRWLPCKAREGAYAVPLLPGGCMAVAREAFYDVGGFDAGFLTWGHEDEEISLKLWLFGYKAFVCGDVLIKHYFRRRHPYSVTPFHTHYNLLRMAFSHFSQERIAKLLDVRGGPGVLSRELVAVIFSDVWKQRQDYFSRRERDDDWFFARFAIPF